MERIMKWVKKVAVGTCGLIFAVLPLSAQKYEQSFVDRLMLDFTGAALIPMGVPTGMGGGLGFGLALRDFNVFLRGTALIAEPGGTTKNIIIPTLRIEAKFSLIPNFLTLLPYIDAGAIMTKVKKFNGELSGNVTTYYAEAGLGAEIMLTHEISLIPRLGIASALLYEGADSNNHSGASVSLSARYLFGRSRALDY
jgi:hypothetical protein